MILLGKPAQNAAFRLNVVVICGMAGRLRYLSDILAALPPQLDLVTVCLAASHDDADATLEMIRGRHPQLRGELADISAELAPDMALVIPPGVVPILLGQRLLLQPQAEADTHTTNLTACKTLIETLALNAGRRSAALILDSALGMRIAGQELRRAGGFVFNRAEHRNVVVPAGLLGASLARHLALSRPDAAQMPPTPLPSDDDARPVRGEAEGDLLTLAETHLGLPDGRVDLVLDDRLQCKGVVGFSTHVLRRMPRPDENGALGFVRSEVRTAVRVAAGLVLRLGSPVSLQVDTLTQADRPGPAVTLLAAPVLHDGRTLCLIALDPDAAHTGGLLQDGGAAGPVAADTAARSHAGAASNGTAPMLCLLEDMLSEGALLRQERAELVESLRSARADRDLLAQRLAHLTGAVEAAQEASNQEAEALETAGHGIALIGIDPQMRIERMNREALGMLGLRSHDLGRPLGDLALRIDDPALIADVADVLATGTPIERDVPTRDGLWFCRRIGVRHDAAGDLRGALMICFDITQRRRSTEGVALAASMANAATDAMRRFALTASHEALRSLHKAELALALLTEEAAVAADTCADATADVAPQGRAAPAEALLAHLGTTLADLRGLATLVAEMRAPLAGGVAGGADVVSLRPMLLALKDDLAAEAAALGVRLRIVPSARAVISLRGMLAAMVRLIAANALRHAQGGAVVIGCRSQGGRVVIEIHDNCPALPPAVAEALQAGDPAGTLRGGGARPAGLALAAQVAQWISHPLAVKPVPGRGNIIRLTLMRAAAGLSAGSVAKAPMAWAETGAATPALSAILPAIVPRAPEGVAEGADQHARAGLVPDKGPRWLPDLPAGADQLLGALVLLIEDEPELQDLTARILRRLGCRTVASADPVAALRAVQEAGHWPDAVVLGRFDATPSDVRNMLGALPRNPGQVVPGVLLLDPGLDAKALGPLAPRWLALGGAPTPGRIAKTLTYLLDKPARPAPAPGADAVAPQPADPAPAVASVPGRQAVARSGSCVSAPDMSGPDMSGPDMSGPDMSGPDISGQGGSGQGGDWPLPAGQQVHLVAADADFGGVLAGWLKRSGCAVQLHEWPGKDLPAAPDGIDALLLIDTDDAPEAGSGAQTDRPTPESVAELIAGARMPTSVLVRRGEGTVPPTAAVRAGAGDVIFKPASPRQILQSLVRAQARWAAGERGVAAQAADETGGFQPLHKAVSPGIPRSATAGPAIGLTERQSDVLQRVLQGHPSKVIAHQLGISQRTVESHRAAIMRAYGARSLPELVRRALAAEPADSGHGGHGRHGGHGGHARPTTGATG